MPQEYQVKVFDFNYAQITVCVVTVECLSVRVANIALFLPPKVFLSKVLHTN